MSENEAEFWYRRYGQLSNEYNKLFRALALVIDAMGGSVELTHEAVARQGNRTVTATDDIAESRLVLTTSDGPIRLVRQELVR